MPKKVLTKARKGYISSLTKSLILVDIGAAFGGEYLFKLSGIVRVVFIASVGLVAVVLFALGVWLAVDGESGEE